MKKILKINNLLIIGLMVLSSCFKEDEKITLVRPGDVSIRAIEMLPDYSIQSYFNLSSGEVVSAFPKDSWDIGLSCEKDDFTLLLNTARFIKIAHTESDNFDVTYTTDGFIWQFDESTGNPSGNAIGKWWDSTATGPVSRNEVMLVDRGIDAEGLPAGYIKIQPLINTSTGEVSIRIANLNGSDERTFSFTKVNGLRYVAMSFESGQNAVQPEPLKTDWDLLFTQYTTLLFTDTGEPYPYLVTGVLLNDTLVSAVMDSITPFESIDRYYTENLVLSKQRDVIGYNWKKIVGDVEIGDVSYLPILKMVYIIKNSDGDFFKLRFVDFYNELGQKGYPTFEYQKL
ncbi:MAG: HmuY family protein [Bacteroidales bacterium]|nr:HmuY family protein [Bacteroidales bacterium]